ncbi:MAG: hydrogenase expression/formation protein HypE [Halieaceae bacterium]|jgi:hydrogenase expression/formation protein HypE|nr:hydrogenase expression/formation protein HypE [Halieaceae bacterium]
MNMKEADKNFRAGRRQARRLDLKHGRVELSHGAGGRAMADLIDLMFRRAFDNPLLDQANDQACFEVASGRMVMTTDSFVISPLFFPGGNIGSLAVHGTVNDLAMGGAQPLYLSAGFILEEGLPLADLDLIVDAMACAAREAGVLIVTGDTKVVERGKGDGVFINTAGIGRVPPGVDISGNRARPGDKVLVSGTLGDHGVAIMSLRKGLQFETALQSDSAALNGLVEGMVKQAGSALRVLRDPTRGGLAATLNEIADQSGVGIRLHENTLPIRAEVRGACELLGLDPLNVANEGKLIAVVDHAFAGQILAAMQADPNGRNAAIVGEVIDDPMQLVRMVTSIGGERVIDWLHGEQLPRIC